MKLRLHSPRELATRLRLLARRSPEEVEKYLDTHHEEWEALAEADPHDAADILEELGEEAATDLIADLDPDDAAYVLEEMHDDLAADILQELDPEDAADLLEEMPADEAADIIHRLQPDAQRELIEKLEPFFTDEVRLLLEYPQDTAGGHMTSSFASLPIGITAGEAIERIRQMNEELEDLSYVYIVDDDGKLLGVLSFRELVFKRPGADLGEVMIPDPVAVTPLTDRETAVELAQRYHLYSLPVVDDKGRLLGRLPNEEIMEAIQLEASEDFALATGAGAHETVFSSVLGSVRMRLPWLSLNLMLALVVTFVIEAQTGIIEDEPVLAALMPVIALLGGNSGFQSLAVVIRALATDDVPGTQVLPVLRRQLAIGVMNGAALAVAAGALAILLLGTGVFQSTSSSILVGLAVGIAALGNVTIAGFAGSGIPLLMRKLGFDPAQASSIFLTLITDIVGFGGFLAVAALLLG
ncbi:MAG TPA: magnesium transporter [Acidimicrobiia bacterium]|nr:magnesium transporter [Acidimicrobiia bacterium]